MGTIRVEFVPIAKYNLGLFGFDHMQIVFEDETDFLDSQDYWHVMEGIHDGGIFGATLGVLGEDGKLQLSSANDASCAPVTKGSSACTLITWSAPIRQFASAIRSVPL